MSRAFDDGRWPSDYDAKCDCFLCGRAVDPLDPKRGAYDEPPAGPQLPIHVPCAAQLFATLHEKVARYRLAVAYRLALQTMSDRQMARAGIR